MAEPPAHVGLNDMRHEERPEHEDPVEDKVVAYRLRRLEEAVISLQDMSKAVTRWDVLFSRIGQEEGFMNCALHREKMEGYDKRLAGVEHVVQELDKFKWRGVGALAAFMFVIQLFSMGVFEKVSKFRQDPVFIYTNAVPVAIPLKP